MAMIKSYIKKNGEEAWYFKAYLGVDPVTKKKKYTTKRNFKSPKAARLAAARLELDVEKNGIPIKSKSTFKEVAELWLANYKNTVKASTYSRTKIIFNKHIYPKFENLNISKINTIYCQKVLNEWSKSGSSKQFPLFLNYMSKVFKYGISIGVATENPILNVIVPKNLEDGSQEKKLKHYTKEQLQQFLNEVEKEEIEYLRIRDYALFRLLAFSGCRIGEVLALTWDDVDLSTNEMKITKTVTKSDVYYISETPKTKKSNRSFFLDQKTISTLKRWKLEQKKHLFKLGFSNPSRIFTNDENNFTINQAVTDRYNRYRERTDLPNIGLHGFRHTHASMLYNAGSDHKEVQERLGHSNIMTTMNTYTHLTEDKKEETAAKLTQYVDF